jgi:Family of unknown function (DUF5343)
MGAMNPAGEFLGRRAPYAPISALERFLDRIRDRAVPELVDHRFLQKLNVASNNEYSLLSALKFLGIVDDRGKPTHVYRRLQSTDEFQDTLRHLVETAYRPVFDMGAERSHEDLVNFFRVSSSPSQAKNAARFFLAVCRLAGIEPAAETASMGAAPAVAAPERPQRSMPAAAQPPDGVLAAKAALVEKLPPARPDWSAEEYRSICELFAQMMHSLDTA